MCSGGGGDGGVAERQAQMRAEQDAAIRQVNELFGKGDGAPITRWEGSLGSELVSIADQPVLLPTGSIREVVDGYDTAARDRNAAQRDQLYSTIQSDASSRLLDRLQRDRQDTERGTKFQLARQGLSGGSADVDQNSRIADRFNEGALEAGNQSLAAANTARSADERSRIGIINNIRNGMSQADAISAAYEGMADNARTARDAAMATSIGDFFSDINMANQRREFEAGQRGVRQVYGPSRGVAGGAGFGGSITQR